MDLILILADHDYPPVPQDDVFKEIFEQAENFKKYEKAECEDKADDSEELARQFSLITAYTVSEASEATIDSKASTDRRPAKKVVEIRLKPVNSVLDDVEKDDDVRRLIHNMMELEDGTTIETIYLECIREYQEKYFSMKPNDWRHLVGDYVRGVTKRPELKEDTLFYYKVS